LPSINLPEYELVGGFKHLEKYEFVNGKDDIPYMKWKIIHSCSKPPTSETVSTSPPGDLRWGFHFQATHLARRAIGLRRRGYCPCQGILHLHGAQPRKLNPWGKNP